MTTNKLADLDILNPDFEISEQILIQLENEIYADLQDKLPQFKDRSPDDETFTELIDNQVAISYIERLNMSVLDDYRDSLVSIQAIARYIRYHEQQSILTGLLRDYLKERLPNLDLDDVTRFLMLDNFSNTFIIYKQNPGGLLDALTVRYLYGYDNQSFTFKIASSKGGYSVSLKQLKMLIDETDETIAQETTSIKSKSITSSGNSITITTPDGKVVTIS